MSDFARFAVVRLKLLTLDLITQLAPRTARARRKLVHKYQFSHGAQRHPIPERPLAA